MIQSDGNHIRLISINRIFIHFSIPSILKSHITIKKDEFYSIQIFQLAKMSLDLKRMLTDPSSSIKINRCEEEQRDMRRFSNILKKGVEHMLRKKWLSLLTIKD